MGASGLLLFVALFLPWYELGQGIVTGPPDVLDAHASAWDAFTILDVLLALGALAAIAVVVVTALEATPAVPIAMQALVTLFAILLLILVVFRLADPPDVTFLESTSAPGARSVVEDIDRVAGAWLALVGIAGHMRGRAARHARRAALAGRPPHRPERRSDRLGAPGRAPPGAQPRGRRLTVETPPASHPEAGA